jgi:hypothetical protein
MRFRIARHVCVTGAQHSEYHSRTQPPFTMKGVPKLRNVATCVDPFNQLSCFQFVLAKQTSQVDADIVLHCNVSSSPLPPVGVFIVPLAGSHHCPAADPASKRVVYIQDDSEDLGSASEESPVAYVPRRCFSENVDDQPSTASVLP